MDYRDTNEVYNVEPVILPKEEYAHVMSELNTNISDEERQKEIIVKPIGDYYYTVVNRGFNDYVIIGKRSIVDIIIDDWSEENE